MMNSPDQFVGGQFAWFTGVVEDISDPLQMGRVRVRCFGYHTSNLQDLPVKDLPWATPLMPVTSASMTGIGQSATGILPGSWVVGFFRDGPSAQDPVILGTIPSRSNTATFKSGFSDPKERYPIAALVAEPDTPRASRSGYKFAPSYIRRNDFRQEDNETASPPKVTSVAVDKPDSYYTHQTWSPPDIENVVRPVYPKNHSIHTESGHTFEVDDTPGNERIFEMHKKGSYYEIDSNGNKITTVVGDNYEVIIGGDNVRIKGSCNLTIDKDLRTLVKGNYHLEVGGDYTQNIKGSIQTKIGGNEEKEIQHTSSENVGKDRNLRVGGNETISISGDRTEIISQKLDQNIVGDASYTITGAKNEIFLQDLKIVTTGKLYLTATTGVQIETPGNIDMVGEGDMNVTITGDISETVSGDQTTTVSGAIEITGATIDLNP